MARLLPEDFGYALQVNQSLWDLVHARRWRYVIHGHSHQRMVRTFDGLTFINAGTLSRDDAPCFAIIDISLGEVLFHDIHEDRISTPPSRSSFHQ